MNGACPRAHSLLEPGRFEALVCAALGLFAAFAVAYLASAEAIVGSLKNPRFGSQALGGAATTLVFAWRLGPFVARLDREGWVRGLVASLVFGVSACAVGTFAAGVLGWCYYAEQPWLGWRSSLFPLLGPTTLVVPIGALPAMGLGVLFHTLLRLRRLVV